MDRALRYGDFFASITKCGEGTPANQAACLRALPVIDTFIDDIDGTNARWPPPPDPRRPPLAPVFPWGPAIDGVEFIDMPIRLLR